MVSSSAGTGWPAHIDRLDSRQGSEAITMMDRVPARLAAAAPWVLAAVGILFYVCAFYPGAIGFDTANQWWQARGGETTNIHGLAMTWAWRLSDHLSSGP